MKKYFINQQADSNKFWNIESNNTNIIIRYGKIGTEGRELIKEFLSNEICIVEFEKLIKDKISKGYIEIEKDEVIPVKSVQKFDNMRLELFWNLIESSLQHKNLEKQANYIKKELKKLTKSDIVEFQNIFNNLDNKIYTWDLWAAAYTIQSGCSDDSFMDFRAWLITRGKTVYDKAKQSSDSLFELGKKRLEQSEEGEDLLYLASEVYEDKFDQEIYEDENIKSNIANTEPAGEKWDEENIEDLKRINPNIFRLFKDDWE
jgi:predicted DNA-binding WGR domain protein